ncbi:hypothetical protein ACFL0L_05385 [Patescibacteria group bacterium]
MDQQVVTKQKTNTLAIVGIVAGMFAVGLLAGFLVFDSSETPAVVTGTTAVCSGQPDNTSCGVGLICCSETCSTTSCSNNADCSAGQVCINGGTCNSYCGVIPVTCGNGILDEGEECDGADIGGVTCNGLGASCDTGTQQCYGEFPASAFCQSNPYGTVCNVGDLTGVCMGSQCGILQTQECVGISNVTCAADCTYNTDQCDAVWQTETQTIPDASEEWNGNCATGFSCYGSFPACAQYGTTNSFCLSQTPFVCSEGCESGWPEAYANQCSVQHCTNGIFEPGLGETGLDCGGPCPACGPDCAANQCRNASGQCAAQTDTTCGRNGVVCVDCTSQGQICNALTGTCEQACIDGEERCNSDIPSQLRSEVCVGGVWQTETQTAPDSKPFVPGLQWEGECFMGPSCDADSTRGCGRDSSNLDDWYCMNIEPFNCTDDCQSEWPEAYANQCSATCGNGIAEPGEQCDGTDFRGRTCDTYQSFRGGTLICTDRCTISTSQCILIPCNPLKDPKCQFTDVDDTPAADF